MIHGIDMFSHQSYPIALAHFVRLTLLLVLFLPTQACKESTTEPATSRRDLLTSTPWLVQKVLALGPAPGQSTDVTNSFPVFTVTFSKDGRYTSILQSGTWELIENDTKIVLDKNLPSETTGEIVELEKSRFRLRLTLPLNDQPTPLEITFVPTEAEVKGTSPELNFETLWREFDTRYSFFGIKRINWDSLYAVYRPQVSATTGDPSLFQIMSSMLENLKDGHVNLITPFASYGYRGWYTRYPANFLGISLLASRYLVADYGTTAEGYMRFGRISNDVGYLYIGPNFSGNATPWALGIDAVIDSLREMRGIVVDIRNNGGGNDALSKIVASRFADQTRVFSYVRWRNPGQDHNDFTDYQPLTLGPLGVRQFLKPVALLTNRRTFSSAEETVLMMHAFPNVTVVGDATGGGSGNPIILQLPNGWTYWVPRWIMYTAEKRVYEGIGLAPDIPLWITPSDSTAGRDAILEKALQHLRAQ